MMILHSKPTIDDSDINVVVNVLTSGHLEDGENVEILESAFRKKYNRKYAAAVSSGFSAIHLALISLEVGENDEVIIPSYTCSALLNPILLLKAKPIIIDVDKDSFNISADNLHKRISKRTKAIIVPHTFGFPAPIEEIISLGIPVIEDCAQAIGGSFKGKLLGNFGQLSVFSFYASKMICSGDGGMILTDNEQFIETIKNFRYYGHKKLHKYLAYNYHMTNLPAALANSQLQKNNEFILKRKELASFYDEYFDNHPLIQTDFANKCEACFYRYPVRVGNKIDIIKFGMESEGVKCGYGVLEGMHQMLDLNDNNFPNTMNNLKSILSLPIYPTLKKEETELIAEKLINLIEKL
ncbi:MAG: hypothetical protein CVV23_08485 [Ignavibacteriae bacterium HGW-Ignavibacteriae-2]|jgi:perosamine synthetase|nr:DegT/DnrJ/EryC1/StrS family aminotransferase [Bacteroidota bacterium]PKL88777.1 MAG: hypothetical protein CVV23_08485 [Ignavibacteriae bacterium HGW-Ignavibacteriae-2]